MIDMKRAKTARGERERALGEAQREGAYLVYIGGIGLK